MDIRVFDIAPDRTSEYAAFIPADFYTSAGTGMYLCFGIEAGKKAVGAVIASTDAAVNDGAEPALWIRSIAPEALLESDRIMETVLAFLVTYAIRNALSGLVVSVLLPDGKALSKLLKRLNFQELQQGNTIYEAAIADLLTHSAIRLERPLTSKTIVRVDELSPEERREFINQMGTRYPDGLSPDRLPGTWAKGLSFVYRKDTSITGYLLCSVLANGTLYVGALYSEGKPAYALALLTRLAHELKTETAFDEVMFASAGVRSKAFCDNLTKGVKSLMKSEFHYYYMEV